jgi:hypothetical protein
VISHIDMDSACCAAMQATGFQQRHAARHGRQFHLVVCSDEMG